MRTTINQLRVELELLQQAYAPLNSFFWGSFERSQDESNTGLTYPLMCCYYNNGADMKGNTVPINLIIVIADRVYDDFSNLNDTESDTLQVCKDIVNIMTNSPRWQKICRVTAAVTEKFIEAREDKVTGHFIRATVTLFDNKNICDTPVFGYDFEGNLTPVCSPVTITDSDGTTVVEVDAGGSFVCTPVEDATYTNSDGSATGTIAPGQTKEFEDIEITTGSGIITRPAIIDLELTDYYQIINQTGTRVPVQSVSNPNTQVAWESLVGVSVGTGTITKTGSAGWNAGAAFEIDTTADFRIEFNYAFSNLTGMAGISFFNPDPNYVSISIAIYNFGSGYQVYVSGSFAAPYNVAGTWPCKIEVIGQQAFCYINNLLIHTQTISAANRGQMLFDCSMFSVGCKLENILLTYLP